MTTNNYNGNYTATPIAKTPPPVGIYQWAQAPPPFASDELVLVAVHVLPS